MSKFKVGETYLGYGLDENDIIDYDDPFVVRIVDKLPNDTYATEYKRIGSKHWNDSWKPDDHILTLCKCRKRTKLEKALK